MTNEVRINVERTVDRATIYSEMKYNLLNWIRIMKKDHETIKQMIYKAARGALGKELKKRGIRNCGQKR